MSTASVTASTRLYDTDFYAWIQDQAATLRAGNLAGLDVNNLIEEIESMGRSEKRELRSRLVVLIVHLLKWAYQPLRRGNSWQTTIWGTAAARCHALGRQSKPQKHSHRSVRGCIRTRRIRGKQRDWHDCSGVSCRMSLDVRSGDG